jgi:hypothetical protein
MICYTDDVYRGSDKAEIKVDGAQIYCLCMIFRFQHEHYDLQLIYNKR